MCESDFLKKLRTYSKRNFKNREEMAKALEISIEQMTQLLKGEMEPDFNIIRALADLDCDMNWLMKEKREFWPN